MSLTSKTTSQSDSHILIVDDELELCQTIALSVQQSGFSTSTAGSVQEACNLMKQESFDVIVTDVIMPDEDGISLLGHMRQTQPEIPVILMTGYAQLQMAIDALKNGAFDFIHKPFDYCHLNKIVERAVNYRRLQRLEREYLFELEETVRKRSEELKEAMLELDLAKSELLKISKLKNEFMSNISHEMRTPMNGVVGSLLLLESEVNTETGKEFLEMARLSADNMVTLIDQLLAFGSGTAGSCEAGFDLINTLAELNAIIAEYQPAFNQKGIFLTLNVASDVPSGIWTYRVHFNRLFSILIGNALKFTKQGGVTFDVCRAASENGEELLHFAVTDTGIGIPEGMLEQVFEPFVQGDGSHTRTYGGLGLGLAIASQNANILDGRLWAEHVSGGGSRFNFRMKIINPKITTL